MVIACDTSFLFSLYGNDAHAPMSLRWISNCTHPLTLTSLNAYELGNAFRLAVFRKMITPHESEKSLKMFEAAIDHGRIIIAPCKLTEVVETASRLSTTYTPKGGHRGFDILHIAGALTLGADEFLTFDLNQTKLANVVGLATPLKRSRPS